MANPPVATRDCEVVVVGSGLAGLACALSLQAGPVCLVSKTPALAGGSSLWAQGGIAAAIAAGDSPEDHAVDTLAAGAGLCDPVQTRRLTAAAAESLEWLVEEGIVFDRDAAGQFELAREAAHRCPRIVHANGDGTGSALVGVLVDRVNETPAIEVCTSTFAWDLVIRRGRVAGLLAFRSGSGWTFFRCPKVVLATGGLGMAWRYTTNPAESSGDGLAMAARAGAKMSDLEFVQFHPTALAVPHDKAGANLPLLTEALRGAGAPLVDEAGWRFMPAEHTAAELAPRDVVARVIHRRSLAGLGSFLDLRELLRGPRGALFPGAVNAARSAGFDPYTEPLPVSPAAHYHMGGIRIGEQGRSSIPGLWACGEVANTGVHGANRLASNSLLEAVVFARLAAADVEASMLPRPTVGRIAVAAPAHPGRQRALELLAEIRQIMHEAVGIARTGQGLSAALQQLSVLDRDLRAVARPGAATGTAGIPAMGETRNILLVSRLIALAALRREESRGAHFRSDFPGTSTAWQRPQSMTTATLAES